MVPKNDPGTAPMPLLAQILPILLLILTGVALRITQVLSDEAVEGLKTLVVTLVLPAVLFTVFLDLQFETAYWGLFALVAAICAGLYGLGLLVRRFVTPGQSYTPFLFTGFEYGMLGVSLFGAAYGLDAVGYIAITDLAHELFIWFVFAPLLMIKRDGDSHPATILRMFATSPVVIGLTAGLALGALGLGPWIRSAPVVSSAYTAATLLAAMVVPLILIIVGHGIRIRRTGLGPVLRLVALRYALVIPLALLLNRTVIGGWLGLGLPFQAAFFTLLILPPPFIVPLFLQHAPPDERAFVTNTLAVSTLVALIAFAAWLAAHPTL